MPPKKKSKRGSNLVSLNKAHPKHDVKHDIDAEPDEDFRPEDAPGDESEDDDDDDLDHESSNPELEKIRVAGRARKKRSRASAAAAKSRGGKQRTGGRNVTFFGLLVYREISMRRF